MADDTAILQQIINNTPAGQTAVLTKSIYIITSTVYGKSGVTLDLNGATIIAEHSRQFEYMLLASNLRDFHVINGILDANQANRTTGQTVRFMTLGFIDCTDCSGFRLRAQNTLGFLPAGTTIPQSACGFVIGGLSLRCSFDQCVAVDCGTTALPADGFFVSGTQCLVTSCKATNCTDTGFILESSNYSGITACTANSCGGGAAITNGSSLDMRGNFIKATTINDWKSTVTGGIQIGCPGPTLGNVIDTDVDAIIVALSAGRGTGPAININSLGKGRAIGVTLTGRIHGASEQGILVNGDDVLICGMSISGTSGPAVQFQSGCVDGRVQGGTIIGGLNGIVGLGSARFSVSGARFRNQIGWGVYAYDTSAAEVDGCTFISPGTGRVGKDNGAPAILFSGRIGAALAVNNQINAPTTGTPTMKIAISDISGNTIGYVPLHSA